MLLLFVLKCLLSFKVIRHIACDVDCSCAVLQSTDVRHGYVLSANG